MLYEKGTNEKVNVWDLWGLGSKFTEFLSFWNNKLVFLQILNHSLVSWDITLLYFFNRNFIYFQQRMSIKVQIWWNFTWAVKVTLIGSFCKNHVKFQLKITEDLSLMILMTNAKLKEKLASGFKYDMRNLVNFHPTT